MKKIPTIFVRDLNNMGRVTDEVHPDCLWVFNSEGDATHKMDGTSCLINADGFWKRREVKKEKRAPFGFLQETFDEITGKRTGWMPVTNNDKWHAEGMENLHKHNAVIGVDQLVHGTYELLGPKVQGNPEGYGHHMLVSHSTAKIFNSVPLHHRGLDSWLENHMFEGIVWHHPDGRMAKIKRRDFGHAWPFMKESS